MKVLIIGLGSIAKKHITALKRIDAQCHIYALRSSATASEISGVTNLYDKTEIPVDIDFTIVSNPTSEHLNTVNELIYLSKPFFIEKPVLSSISGSEELLNKINKAGLLTYVACNMRFHPIIQRLKEEMTSRKPIEMTVYCGSYLPDWRPEQDYRKTYSALEALGGGVHLDLIHEIDYCFHMLGEPQSVLSSNFRKSKLDIETIDLAHYVLDYEQTTVFITLNYFRRDTKRQIECVWEDETWTADLLKNEIRSHTGALIFRSEETILDTYYHQMKFFLKSIEEGEVSMNHLAEAISVLSICLNEYEQVT